LSFINFAAREINCKIVYYGAGLGGKPVVFSLGDLRAFATTNGSGSASAQLPVRVQPGTSYAVTANFDGDAGYQAASFLSLLHL